MTCVRDNMRVFTPSLEPGLERGVHQHRQWLDVFDSDGQDDGWLWRGAIGLVVCAYHDFALAAVVVVKRTMLGGSECRRWYVEGGRGAGVRFVEVNNGVRIHFFCFIVLVLSIVLLVDWH